MYLIRNWKRAVWGACVKHHILDKNRALGAIQFVGGLETTSGRLMAFRKL